MRIRTLLPNATETAFALEWSDSAVGVSHHLVQTGERVLRLRFATLRTNGDRRVRVRESIPVSRLFRGSNNLIRGSMDRSFHMEGFMPRMSRAVRAVTLVLLACVVPWTGHDAKAEASAQEEIRAVATAGQRFLGLPAFEWVE